MNILENNSMEQCIKNHIPFIIRTISHFTGRYVNVENDEEFSIGLLAFEEAIHKYDENKGSFLSFARLVIESRLSNYERSKVVKEGRSTISLDHLYEQGLDFSNCTSEEDASLQEEISIFCKELHVFGLDLDILADACPKHRDTKRTAIDVAIRASEEDTIVKATYTKKKLPIRMVACVGNVSEKVIKRSKTFILGTMLIFVKDLHGLIQWIMETRQRYVS